nr:hypothetical protein [Tanacetum cinerariifolium]
MKEGIGSYWIYKTRFKVDGSKDKKRLDWLFKAIDKIAAVKGWFTCQMDVSNGFLHGYLFKKVYIRPPQGYAGQGKESNDQAIQTILLGLLEEVYAVVDSCETTKEIWLHVQQMMKGSDIGAQEKKAKLFNECERFTSTD